MSWLSSFFNTLQKNWVVCKNDYQFIIGDYAISRPPDCVDIKKKSIISENNVNLLFLDVPGVKYQSNFYMYHKAVYGIIAIFDLTNGETFKVVHWFYDFIESWDKVPKILVGWQMRIKNNSLTAKKSKKLQKLNVIMWMLRKLLNTS